MRLEPTEPIPPGDGETTMRTSASGTEAFRRAGLCSLCRHARRIVSARGSTFYRCTVAEVDPRFPKYPRLPVRACVGFLPEPDASAGEGAATTPPA